MICRKTLRALSALTAVLALLTLTALAAEAPDYAASVPVTEISSSDGFTGEHFTVRTPADEENTLYVEGQALGSPELLAIRLLNRNPDETETTNVLQVFVRPDSDGAFSVKIDTAAGSTAAPEILDGKGTAATAADSYSTMPGYKAVPEMAEGFYRLTVTAAYTAEDAEIGSGSEWWSGPLGGSHGCLWKGAVLQVSGSNNNPRLVTFPNVADSRETLRAELEPNDDTVAAYPGAYVRYLDPLARDLASVMKNPNTGEDEELSEAQAAYIAEVAADVTAGADSDYEKLLKIYEYVADSFYYDFYDLETAEHQHCNPYYNLYALREGFEVSNGADGKVATVCDGYAAMVITMARSQGIPARMIRGFALEGMVNTATWGNTPVEEDNHLWAEAWVDGRWIVIDAKLGSHNRWDRENAEDEGLWTKRDTISYDGFDPSDRSFDSAYLVTEIRGGDTAGRFLCYEEEVAALRAFLDTADSDNITNGAKLNPAYDPDDLSTWGGDAKFLTDGFGRAREISWGSRELAGEADFSALSALRWLTLNTNDLTTLSVDGCKELYYLNANYNSLTAIDTSACKALETLSLRGNELTSAAFCGPEGTVTLTGEHGEFAMVWEASSAEPLTVIAGAPAAEGYVFDGVYDSDGQLVSAETEYSFFPADTAYTVRFRQNLDERLPAPAVTASNANNGHIQLNWTAVEGAAGYTVRRADSPEGPFTLCYTADASKLSFQNSGAALGETWYYQVRAVCAEDENKNSMPAETVSATRILPRPAPSSAVDGDSGRILLTWEAVEGADRYAVLRAAAEAGPYATIGTTAETRYTDTSAAPGTYWYKLISLCDADGSLNSLESYTVSRTCRPGRPRQLKGYISPTGKPMLEWEAVEGAEKYAVYTSVNGSTPAWTAYAPEPSYTHTKAVAGTETVYSVRTVIDGQFSLHSDAVSLPCPEESFLTGQPADKTVSPGGKATFSVKAAGSGLTYRWQYRTPTGSWKNTTFSGYKTGTLTVTAKAYHDGYQYRCLVTRADGLTACSAPALLTVKETPAVTFTAQPQDMSATVGGKAKFTVEAQGSGLTYQWQYKTPTGKDWKSTTFSGCKTAALTVTAKAYHNGYQYRCAVSSGGTTVYSDPATLTVSALSVTAAPADAAIAVGKKAVFTVEAEGAGTLTYRWQYRTGTGATWKNTTFSGYKTDTLTVTAKAYHDGYQYRCKVTDSTGATVYSAPADLSVLAVTAQPQTVTAAYGKKVTFTVEAQGSAPLTYRWQYRTDTGTKWYNSSAASARTDSFTVTAYNKYDGYRYRCRITDSAGNTVTSSAAYLYLK